MNRSCVKARAIADVPRLGSAITAVLLFLFSISTHAQGVPIRTDKEIAAWAAEYMENAVRFDQFSGSVLIARNGKPIFEMSYGTANMELNVPNRTDTKFRIGSISKQFTAAAIMKLQEQGKLSIHDPICNYLAGCPDAWKAISVKHLLNHTSGLVNFTSLPEASGVFLITPHSHSEVVNIFRNKALESQPGEKYNYNNSGYYLLGMIIEKISGTTYAEFLRENIFNPLGMSDTGFDDQKTIVHNRASGYSLGPDMIFYNTAYTSMDILFSMGGLYSTVEDLLRWEQSFSTGRFLSRSTIDEVFTPGKGSYGYGWWIDKLGGQTRMYHAGGVTDFSSSLQRLPDQKLTVIALSNRGEDGGIRAAYDIAGKICGVPATIRGIQSELTELKAEESLNLIAQAKANFPIFDVREAKLEELGNYLMLVKNKAQAIEVFKVNFDLYPKSSNACLKLANAYKNAGENGLAAKTFERCNKIDAGGKGAVNSQNN